MKRIVSIQWIVISVLLGLVGARGSLAFDTPPAAGASPATAGRASQAEHGHGAGAPHDAHDVHDATHGPKLHGAPPVGLLGKGTEFLAIRWPLLLWTVVVFVIVALILNRFAWKPILEALESREHRIEASLKAAEEARADARRLLEQHDARMGEAHDAAKRILDDARQEATHESETALAKAKADAAAAQEQALAEIESAKRAALVELKARSGDLAVGIASRVTGKSFSADDSRRLVDEVMA